MTDRQTRAIEVVGLVVILMITTFGVWYAGQRLDRLTTLPVVEPAFTYQSMPDAVETTLKSCVHVANVTQGWQGSAVAIASDILVTARHVAEGGREFLITTVDGNDYTATQAISSKKYDIGFIKLDEHVLTPSKTGYLDPLRLGDPVYVIGGSLGKMNWPNVTAGIISCLSRDLESYGAPKDFGWSVLWQVDAATYGGNSGGPIFTLDGVARGILVGGMGGSECLSYCVPMSMAVPDIRVIRAMFVIDEYRVEEVPVYDPHDEYYNHSEGHEYY